MKLGVFGSGYVGLVTATCFAEMGNHIHCVDVDDKRVKRLNKGECPIYEPGLEDMLTRNCKAGRIVFSTDAITMIQECDILFIAVGTPPQEDGSADLQHVLAVANTIGQHLNEYKVIIDKSTVPVGTADKVRATICQALVNRGADIEFDVVSNPEFLKEGCAIEDCMRPDRIVVGTSSDKAAQIMRTLYAPFNRNHDKLIIMDERSAEMTKYAANAMLATKISFMNEMSCIAEKVGADIEHVRLGIGSDSRIGFQFIYSGCGYGGSCFPKDVQALTRMADDSGHRAEMLHAVHDVNERQKHVLLDKVLNHFDNNVAGKTFALWGLSFKPNTDDVREAPSRVIMEGLWQQGAKIQAFDPEAMSSITDIYGKRKDLTLCETPELVLQNADALIVVTEWTTFRSPDFNLIRETLSESVIFDGRNLYDPGYLQSLGIQYYAIGRGN